MIISDGLPENWQHTRETRMLLRGQAGAIELLVNGLEKHGVEKPRALALICPPHPLHGGSMDNKVVFTLARACRDSNIIAVRLNFRGVGRSEGMHDDGVGELQDADAILKKIHAVVPDLPVVLAGFSFGAAIAAQLAQTAQCAGLLLSAPPVPRYGLNNIVAVNAPVLLLQCDDDEVTDSAAVYHWFEKLSASGKVVQRWPQGGHFFHGMLPDLKTATEDFLSTVTI